MPHYSLEGDRVRAGPSPWTFWWGSTCTSSPSATSPCLPQRFGGITAETKSFAYLIVTWVKNGETA